MMIIPCLYTAFDWSKRTNINSHEHDHIGCKINILKWTCILKKGSMGQEQLRSYQLSWLEQNPPKEAWSFHRKSIIKCAVDTAVDYPNMHQQQTYQCPSLYVCCLFFYLEKMVFLQRFDNLALPVIHAFCIFQLKSVSTVSCWFSYVFLLNFF